MSIAAVIRAFIAGVMIGSVGAELRVLDLDAEAVQRLLRGASLLRRDAALLPHLLIAGDRAVFVAAVGLLLRLVELRVERLLALVELVRGPCPRPSTTSGARCRRRRGRSLCCPRRAAAAGLLPTTSSFMIVAESSAARAACGPARSERARRRIAQVHVFPAGRNPDQRERRRRRLGLGRVEHLPRHEVDARLRHLLPHPARHRASHPAAPAPAARRVSDRNEQKEHGHCGEEKACVVAHDKRNGPASAGLPGGVSALHLTE